jgi:hypothetical protein
MKLAHPPGVRSCYQAPDVPGLGGTWDSGRLKNGGTSVHVSFEALFESMTGNEIKMLRSELGDSMRLAERGTLVYAVKATDGDVCQMDCAPTVLELRLDDYEYFDPDSESYMPRKFRAYFSEPDALPGKLVLLSVHGKIPDETGLDEQNEHAREAAKLSYDHGVKVGVIELP